MSLLVDDLWLREVLCVSSSQCLIQSCQVVGILISVVVQLFGNPSDPIIVGISLESLRVDSLDSDSSSLESFEVLGQVRDQLFSLLELLC